MGCDIHLYAEKLINGKWICISPMVYEQWGSRYDKRVIGQIYGGRDYVLFGFLAQVRTEQEKGFEPKGFPRDASKEVIELYKEWDGDAHSASHLTLKELNNKFIGDVTLSGMMAKKQFKKLKNSIEKGKPNWDLLYPYCGWTGNKSWESFEIKVPIEVELKFFYEEVISFLKKHTYNHQEEEHKEEEVRIVFWFDN